ARKRRNRAKHNFPQGSLTVAPPGYNEEFDINMGPDLWVHTSPGDWADAVFRTAGVVAEYSCDPAKRIRIKEAVMSLGQKRSRRSNPNFLVLEPVIPGKYNLLASPVHWEIKAPSDPWIISIHDVGSQPTEDSTLHTPEEEGIRHTDPYANHPKSLPGIWEVFHDQLNPGSKRPNEGTEDDSPYESPRKARRL
ncbi:hypothetical protein H0H93_014675, partial [Arthromyces matolae]